MLPKPRTFIAPNDTCSPVFYLETGFDVLLSCPFFGGWQTQSVFYSVLFILLFNTWNIQNRSRL